MSRTVRALATLAVLLLAAASAVQAELGIDVSSPKSDDTFKCAKQHGIDFVVARSFLSTGSPDPTVLTTHAQATGAGLQFDVYHFPCKGKKAEDQVKEDVDHIGKDKFDRLWFDIETNPSSGCGWSGDKNDNCQFLGKMIEEGHKEGIKVGVYSSQYMWSSIMGDDCHTGSDHGVPLWYAHYDDKTNFDDYVAFGGWAHPTMKQYWDSTPTCGLGDGADANFR